MICELCRKRFYTPRHLLGRRPRFVDEHGRAKIPTLGELHRDQVMRNRARQWGGYTK